MQKLLHLLIMLLCSIPLMAQNTMRVHYNDGTQQDTPLSQIDQVTFVEAATPTQEAILTGQWLWGSREAGYYELLTLNDDHTYTGYDNYFTYGFDTMTYGWYSLYGNMLTLQSNGFGYNRLYNWFLVSLTPNALEVMTKMGHFIYYRLQPEVLTLTPSLPCTTLADDDTLIFTDGIIATIQEGKLQGLTPGTTYVLVRQASDGNIVAYKAIVK